MKLRFQIMVGLCALWSFFVISGCADESGFLDHYIEKHGYISYKTPLEHAGTGTLLGGKPDSLALIAHPETCFPPKFAGEDTLLRRKDISSLPSTEQSFSMSGGLNLLLQPLAAGSPSIHGGLKAGQVNKVSVELKGVHVEYIDAIALSNFYRTKMSSLCKDYLDRVGFIVQAIRIDQMNLQFFRQNNVKIKLDNDVLEGLLTIPPEVTWSIANKSTFVIDTPKYIGYQLASLRREDNGLVLRRAKRTYYNQFLFESVDLDKPTNFPGGEAYSKNWNPSLKPATGGRFKMTLDQVERNIEPFNFELDVDDIILDQIY